MIKNCYYILFIFCFWSCHQEPKPTIAERPLNVVGDFMFDNKVISAGDKLTIQGSIENNIIDKPALAIILDHVLYSKLYPITLEGDNFILEIPGEANQIIGQVRCMLMYQEQLIKEARFFINPLDATDKMQSFNGPKDLFAGDNDASMNVSIPHDEYDNPMLPPAIVNYQSSYEGVVQKSEEKQIETLIAYQINPTKNKKGKYLIGSSSKQGYSQEQELKIGAAMPDKFFIELLSFHPFADSRQYMQFKTSVIKDKNENIVADGTLVNFTIQEERHLEGVYQSFTIGGIANVYIENPSKETKWNVQASLHDQIVSNKVLVNFSKNVNDFEVVYKAEDHSFSIGPVVGILGQFVPDGTEIKISCEEKSLEDFTYLENGVCNYQLPFDWIDKSPKEIEIRIGGHAKIIQLD